MDQPSNPTAQQHRAESSAMRYVEAAHDGAATEWRVSKEQLAAAERATLYHARLSTVSAEGTPGGPAAN